MIPRNALLCAAMLATLAAPTALADEFQVSVGAERLFDSTDTQATFDGLTGRGSYFFNQNFGIEGEGTLGAHSSDTPDDPTSEYNLNSQFGGYFVARKQVGESGELFGRVGFRRGSMDVKRNLYNYFATNDYDTDTTPNYSGASIGVGYSHFFNEKLGLRGEVTTSEATFEGFAREDGNLTSASISLVAKFGK